jgi:hypothetical protein
MARTPRQDLPEVLRSPMLADRLASELETAARAVEGDDFLARDRRAFLASAALQVAGLGTEGMAAGANYSPDRTARFQPSVTGDELETRTG